MSRLDELRAELREKDLLVWEANDAWVKLARKLIREIVWEKFPGADEVRTVDDGDGSEVFSVYYNGKKIEDEGDEINETNEALLYAGCDFSWVDARTVGSIRRFFLLDNAPTESEVAQAVSSLTEIEEKLR